jgi:tRNA(Ile)-lysidine synthase
LQPAVKKSVDKKAWPPLLHRVVRTVQSRNLFHSKQHLLVAISGGPDSVALLSLLTRLRASWELTLSAVHCNYGLRGAESEGDQKFVEAFCQGLGVPLYVRRVDLPTGGRKASLQAKARDLRYQVIQEIAEQCGADRIAIGHTADDQAETVLLWMLRGAGLTGLSGMPAFRNDTIIRPLYEITRQEILTYLYTAGLSFREDSSNEKPIYLRNRIRHEVVPILRQLVPSSVDALCRLADICREDDRYLDEHSAALCSSALKLESAGGWEIDRLVLQQRPLAVQRRILRRLFQQSHGQSRSSSIRTIDRVIRLAAKRGRLASIDVRRGCVIVENSSVRFVPFQAKDISFDHRQQLVLHPQLLPVPGQLVWPGTGQRLQVHQCTRDEVPLSLGLGRIVVDADRISQPLVVRTWSPGDRFHPLGMKGHSKKLQDFFTDCKVPTTLRPVVPLVAAHEGIVWVVGYRQDHRWMPSATTERCLVFTVEDLPHKEGTS